MTILMNRTAIAAVVTVTILVSASAYSQQIVVGGGAAANVQLAAKETRRYLYLRTGRLLPIAHRMPPGGEAIAVTTDASLAAEEYRLRTTFNGSQRLLTISGGSAIGALYGAYALAEKLGVRFYLHGDVVPDEQIPFALPSLNETRQPLFALRGVNPWGSHPFGFDAWNADDYKAVITQLAKMRMNFLGIHCYPEGHPYAEPTVWHGLAGDFDAQGRVKASYVSRYFNTLLAPAWGDYLPKKTGDYSFGGGLLFDRDDWAPLVLEGYCPLPQSPQACNDVFNRTGRQFRDAFTFAGQLGVKTCLGTETPLTIPAAVQQRAHAAPAGAVLARSVYEATFRRIIASHPLDYYWLWTPEGWTWSGNNPAQYSGTVADIRLAIQAAKNVHAPFQIATAGWVLGPAQDRAALDRDLPKDIPLSAISRNLGYDEVDPGFARITGRQKWAIPWLESDGRNGLAAVQLFAGRTRRDAADALAYRCTGLMGLHWRTDILSPNISALAQAAWDQSWNVAPIVGKRQVIGRTAQDYHADTPRPRSAACGDFYADWARANFGRKEIGKVFAAIDGQVPASVADGCPSGSLAPDATPWSKVALRFAFIDELQTLRCRIHGAGNLDRFDYWLDTFQYHRLLAQLRCALAAANDVEITRLLADAYRHLLATVNTPGAMAMVVNLENHRGWGALLAKSVKQPWPREYQGKPRIVVPMIRNVLVRGESLALKIAVLDNKPVQSVNLVMRPLGAGPWSRVTATHINRGVWRVALPAAEDDFEYYLEAALANGRKLVWPVTSPQFNQTVVVR
jgi:hypothetical protein